MKRLIAVLTAMLLFVPILSYAGDREGWYFHNESIYLETDEEWNVKENTTVEYISEDFVCARAFTGFKDGDRIDLFFVESEDIPKSEVLSISELEDEFYSYGEMAVCAVADHYFMNYDTYDISVDGSVKLADNDYLKLTLTGEYLDEDYSIYFAKNSNSTYSVFSLRGDVLTDEQIRETEEIIASMEDYDCAEYMFDSYDIMGSSGIDGFDMVQNGPMDPFGPRGNGDFGDYIVGIIGVVIGLIILVIFIAVRKNNKKRDNESGMDGRPVEHTNAYASSDSYERSIKTMLDSGVITRKEYRELRRKHRE